MKTHQSTSNLHAALSLPSPVLYTLSISNMSFCHGSKLAGSFLLKFTIALMWTKGENWTECVWLQWSWFKSHGFHGSDIGDWFVRLMLRKASRILIPYLELVHRFPNVHAWEALTQTSFSFFFTTSCTQVELMKYGHIVVETWEQ